MKVREYLTLPENRNLQFTFIIATARKDAGTPFFHAEYHDSALMPAQDWMTRNNADILDSIILNDRQAPIVWMSGVDWNARIRSGRARCLLIIEEQDFYLLYPSESQRNSMEKFISDRLHITRRYRNSDTGYLATVSCSWTGSDGRGGYTVIVRNTSGHEIARTSVDSLDTATDWLYTQYLTGDWNQLKEEAEA